MKLRIKYGKTGSLKYIGHLDVMRFFQKAIRRANIDITYSKGYSPHQIISFAAPMPIGMTSEGEYFDGEFNSVTSSNDMIDRLNRVMVDGMKVYDIVLLDDSAKNSMSVVTASDYVITINDDYAEEIISSNLSNDEFSFDKYHSNIEEFMNLDSINIMKKTKKSENIVDIKESIYKIEKRENAIYVLVSSGSVNNLKPNLVMEALCSYIGKEYNQYKFSYHRLETYMGEKNEFTPLIEAGKRIS